MQIRTLLTSADRGDGFYPSSLFRLPVKDKIGSSSHLSPQQIFLRVALKEVYVPDPADWASGLPFFLSAQGSATGYSSLQAVESSSAFFFSPSRNHLASLLITLLSACASVLKGSSHPSQDRLVRSERCRAEAAFPRGNFPRSKAISVLFLFFSRVGAGQVVHCRWCQLACRIKKSSHNLECSFQG